MVLDRIYQSRIAFGIMSVLIIWGIGGLFYYQVEKFSLIDSFYFAATTLTTVGFGDLHPKTPTGKMFTIAYVFIGLGVVLYVITQVGRYYLESQFERVKRRKSNQLNTQRVSRK